MKMESKTIVMKPSKKPGWELILALAGFVTGITILIFELILILKK